MKNNSSVITAGLLAPLFLGMAPVLGKLAINAGADPFTVAAWRTVAAVVFLWIIYLLFARRFIYIYPAGLFGCVIIGVVNGIGSLFYYGGLSLVDASLAQLLNGMYLIFVVLLSHVGGERLDRRTLIRVILAVIALVIIAGFGKNPANWLGVGLMLANALMFAGTVILSQYVLYEMPSPTVTLYSLTTMAVLVAMVWVAVGKPLSLEAFQAASPPILLLAITTAASRMALFSGIKAFGSLRTAVLALTEIGVALTLAFFLLNERLTPSQVVGVIILMLSISLIRTEDISERGINPNRLFYNVADIQFQWIAFDQAFGKSRPTATAEILAPKLSTEEIHQIRRMMGVSKGPVTPIELASRDSLVQVDSAFRAVAKTPIYYSIYYPEKLNTEDWLPLYLYVFHEQATEAVLTDAENHINLSATAFHQPSIPMPIQLTSGRVITASLKIEGCELNPPELTGYLEKEWQRYDFYVKGNGIQPNEKRLVGILNIHEGDSLVAHIPIGV